MESQIIKEGFKLLVQGKRYDQLTVVKKLKYLGCSVSPATFGKVLKAVKVSSHTLHAMAAAIQELIRIELDHGWASDGYRYLATEGWKPMEVRESTREERSIHLHKGFVFHTEGRLEIQEKVRFIRQAQKEVVEFGLALNTFTAYFKTRKDSEFKAHVEALLKQGVNFKCYLLDPDSNEANIYLEDRRREEEDEMLNVEPIRETIRKLGAVKKELTEKGFPGNFEVFTYKHIPYNHFMIVDGATPNGSMMVSHYMYGVPRAKCPVMELTKSDNHDLYIRYWSSYQKLIKGAKSIVPKATK